MYNNNNSSSSNNNDINPLNDERYDYEDDIVNSEYYTLISRIKDEYIKKY